MLAASLAAKAQQPDSVFERRTLDRTRVTALFSLYLQDGDHSAVTGGKGTERLTVYGTDVQLTHTTPSRHQLKFGLGGDLVSSASTDRIDMVVSSASRLDLRAHARAAYVRNLPAVNSKLEAGTGLSTESDYMSLPFYLSFEKKLHDYEQKIRVTGRASFDDLRWGRYTHGFFNPQKLVYPSELRYRDWYDTYLRRTYQLSAGWSRRLGSRFTAGLYPGIIYQEGLLATPFHRVYFQDDSVRVERFPGTRHRFPLRIRGAWQMGSRSMLSAEYLYYTDDFGIRAHGIEAGLPFRTSPGMLWMPFVRLYRQEASRYFRTSGMHDPASVYYTSDYDFSDFESVKAGVALRLDPAAGPAATIRYAWYQRSDGLAAHIISLQMMWPGTDR